MRVPSVLPMRMCGWPAQDLTSPWPSKLAFSRSVLWASAPALANVALAPRVVHGWKRAAAEEQNHREKIATLKQQLAELRDGMTLAPSLS